MSAWRVLGWFSWRLGAVAAFAAALALMAWGGPAQAEALRGVALVVGNGRYEHIAALPNPAEDSRAINDLVDGLGFDTTARVERNATELKRDIDRFVEDADVADVALFYYAGHAIEADGENWLVPLDAEIKSLETARNTLIPLSEIVDRLQAKAKVVIVLLDACRDNPFPQGALLRTEAGAAPVAIQAAGLGEPRGASAMVAGGAENLATVIGFAAEKGKVALDGVSGSHSPYVAALLKHMAAAGASFSDVMTMVTEEVYLATGARQRPWVNASLRRVLYFGRSEVQDDADEALLRDARRGLLMTIAATPVGTRGFVEQLAAREKLPLDQIYGILTSLRVDVAAGPAALEEQLTAGAENLRRITAGRMAPLRDDPELARLSDLADRAEAEGAIALAKSFRARASARADEMKADTRRRLEDAKADQLQIAATYAAEAETAYLAFDRATAARRYNDAFAAATGVDDRLALEYRIGETTARADIFIEGDPDIEEAVAVGEDALAIARRIGDPAALADAQVAMASVWENASILYGLQGDEDKKLNAATDNAKAAYRQALSEELKQAYPLRWAAINRDLAVLLAPLVGVHERDGMVAALAAVDDALTVVSASEPLWADLQTDRAHRLSDLARVDKDPALYRLAVAAYRAALSGNLESADQVIAAHSGLADVLLELNATENDVELLRAAVDARRAMFAATTEDDPVWAARLVMLGDSLLQLATQDTGTAALHEAVALYLAALGRIKAHPDHGFVVEDIHLNLATSFDLLGRRERSAAYYAGAVSAYRAALVPGLRESSPLRWAILQRSIGGALGELAFVQPGKDSGTLAQEAFAAYRAALTLHKRHESPQAWAITVAGLAFNMVRLSEHDGDKSRFTEAVAILRDAYAILSAAGNTDAPYVGDSLCRALLNDGISRSDRRAVEEGKAICGRSAAQYVNDPWALSETNENLGRIEQALSTLK